MGLVSRFYKNNKVSYFIVFVEVSPSLIVETVFPYKNLLWQRLLLILRFGFGTHNSSEYLKFSSKI